MAVMSQAISPTIPFGEARTDSTEGEPDTFYMEHPSCGDCPFRLTSSYFENCHGKQLFSRYWTPVNQHDIRGVVYLCHGFAEHLQWYTDLAGTLASRGLLIFGHDHVGHGCSDGMKGHVSKVEEYVNDVIKHCDFMKKTNNGLPYFIVGHSMGGMIAIRAAMKRPSLFSGAVLMGPLIQPDPDEATPVKIAMVKCLAKVMPYLPVAKLKNELVTRDKEMRTKIRIDPLRYHGGIRARWAVACHEELEMLAREQEEVAWPFLILHGEEDKLCYPEGSKVFYKKARSCDKKLKVFPGASHNLYIELPEVRLEAIQDTVDWIVARTPQQK